MKHRSVLSILCICMLICIFLCSSVSGKVPLVVQTKYGPVIGALTFTNQRIFKGIPFAAPPVGELRWKAPQEPSAWKLPLLCDKFKSSCPSYPSSTDLDLQLETFDEDCLYLNIWTPAEDQASKLPVMVYIHGGSFLTGSAAKSVYNGAYLAKKGIVVVTINYRLGVFGFFCHPGLAESNTRGSFGNYGLLDQIMALRWVKQNIAAFGGDPDNVTLFGESAGAVSVLALMGSDLSHGLFNAAIAQSGAIPFSLKDRHEASALWARMAKKVGIEDFEDSLAALRELSWQQLLKMNPSNDGMMPARSSLDLICIDGLLFTEQPLDVWKAGRQAKVPLIVGSNSDEMGIISSSGPSSLDEYSALLRKYFGRHSEVIIQNYPFDHSQPGRAFADVMSDSIFRYSSLLAATLHSKAGCSTYHYLFSYAGKLLKSAGLGAFHASDLLYLFGVVDNVAFPAEERKMAQNMAEYWTSFAKSGVPSPQSLPGWPAFNLQERFSMQLDTKLQPIADIGLDRFLFWRGIIDIMIEEGSFLK